MGARVRTAVSAHPVAGLAAVAIGAAALWFSHLPSLLLNAQFYADDGGWYQAAYQQGPIRSLAHAAAGYIVMVQRAGASASLSVPLIAAPTFFNALALLADVVLVCYLLSARMAAAIPSLAARVALAFLIIAVPNAYDTGVNLTNAQWHLGLLAFLVVFATTPRGPIGWGLDIAILALSGLSGPNCILLEPVLLVLALRRRDDRRLRLLVLVNSLCVGAQVLVIATHIGSERASGSLAAGFDTLVRMIGRQVTLGLLIGAHGLAHVAASILGSSTAVLTLLALVPIAVCGIAVWRGPLLLRAFCLYAAAELLLGLVSPSAPAPKWVSLGNPADISTFHPGAIRYFLYPLLAFAVSAGWLAMRGWHGLRMRSTAARDVRWLPRAGMVAAGCLGAAVVLCMLAVGVPADWKYPPYIDAHWPAQVARVQSAPVGARVTIPINPPGWNFTLVVRR